MEIKNLNEVCMINMGQSPDSSSYNDKKEGLAFYQGNADFGEIHPTTRVWCNNPIKIAEKDDILISVRAPIGSMNIANEKCCIGRGLASIKPIDKNECNQNYLYYFLESKVPYMQSKGTGSTFKAINKGILTSLQIKLPNIREQEKISSIISKIKAQIHNKKLQIRKYDELVKSQFIEMFGDRLKNTKHWDEKELKECVDFYNGKAHEQVVDNNGQYILVTSRCIASDLSDFRRTNTLLFPLQQNDITMVMSDVPNGKAFAKCMLIQEDNKFTLNQRICCLRNYNFNPIFLLHLLNRHEYFLQFDDGNSQTNLRKNDLLRCNVIIPPIELQNQFADFVKHIDKLKFTIKQTLEKLELCYKSLMKQYFD